MTDFHKVPIFEHPLSLRINLGPKMSKALNHDKVTSVSRGRASARADRDAVAYLDEIAKPAWMIEADRRRKLERLEMIRLAAAAIAAKNPIFSYSRKVAAMVDAGIATGKWERGFLKTIGGRSDSRLSERQKMIVDNMYARMTRPCGRP